MKYMLLICDDPSADATGTESAEPWVEEFGARRGLRRHGYRLRPADEATTVRVREGEVLTADGPFAETKEQVAGYDVIECDSLAEAVEAAAAHPMAACGAVEVRGYWDPADDVEGRIRNLEDEMTRALGERDVDRLAACVSPDVEMFGPEGPLAASGVAEYRKIQESWLATVAGPVRRDVTGLRLHVGDHVAFGHAVNRVRAALADGGEVDVRLRTTTGYGLVGNRWLVTHQHVSLPRR